MLPWHHLRYFSAKIIVDDEMCVEINVSIIFSYSYYDSGVSGVDAVTFLDLVVYQC